MHHVMSQVLPPFVFWKERNLKSEGINTGLRLSKTQFEKLERIADSLNVSRNRVVGMLIDGAEVRSRPAVTVQLVKENSQSAQNVVGTSAMAVVG